jgi:hypothetical protein
MRTHLETTNKSIIVQILNKQKKMFWKRSKLQQTSCKRLSSSKVLDSVGMKDKWKVILRE